MDKSPGLDGSSSGFDYPDLASVFEERRARADHGFRSLDARHDFNRILETLQRQGVPVIKPTESDDTNQPQQQRQPA
jgi:hypothetical protein